MKAKSIIGILIGLVFIALSIGAFFSGEPASLTLQGRIITGLVLLMGLGMVGSNASQLRSTPPPQPTFHPFTRPTLVCHQCGKVMHEEFKVCPFCGTPRQLKCPVCQGAIESTYNVCPHCGHRLKDTKL